MKLATTVLALAVIGYDVGQPSGSSRANTSGAVPVRACAPMPWEVPSDERTAARVRGHRGSDEPLLRELARREVRVGDDVEVLIDRHPECRVIRCGRYTALRSRHGCYGSTSVIARDGKVAVGVTGDCTYYDQLFNTLGPREWDESSICLLKAEQEKCHFGIGMPAVCGGVAWVGHCRSQGWASAPPSDEFIQELLREIEASRKADTP